MGSLIAYSGIATKVKAMERWRIKDEQFLEMAALETVADAVQYLRSFLPYREIFDQVEDGDLHRGNIEQHLNLSQYRDFAKLYKFANIKQRRFLDLYFTTSSTISTWVKAISSRRCSILRPIGNKRD